MSTAPPLSWFRAASSHALWNRDEPHADPPATLLRLPAAMRLESPRRDTAPAGFHAQSRDCRHEGLQIGTARSQAGMVKLWRARAVDLRPLLFAPDNLAPALQARPQVLEAALHDAAPGTLARALAPSSSASSQVASRLLLLARRLALALQPPPEALLRSQGPLHWPGALYAFQRDGVRALLRSPSLLLGDEMGLGKGVQAIAAMRLLLHRREIERALVVVPASLLDQWRGELARWAPELRVMTVRGSSEERLWQWQYRAHVTLTSYETLRVDSVGSQSGPQREEWGVVVLDEAQRIRNRATDLARACHRLPRSRSWALSGTPLENRAADLVSILSWVRHSASSGAALSMAPSIGLATASEPALRAMLGSVQLRRRKADVLAQLPPKTITRLLLLLSPAQQRAYQKAAGEAAQSLSEQPMRAENALALLTRLKQICNFEAASGDSSKADDLAARLDEITQSGHKALVFTQYAGDFGASRLAERLAHMGPLQYTGAMSLAARERALEAFRSDPNRRVLILSLQAGGAGLNLPQASYVFHFDRWWNPAVEAQAEGRAHRIGQQNPVQVYQYVMAQTVEERVDEILVRKSQEFARLVEGSSLDVAELLGELEADDWRELAGLPPGAPSGSRQPHELSNERPGVGLEKRVARLLERQGYRVESMGEVPFGAGRDGGIDLSARKSDALGAQVRLFVQCKDYSKPLGVEAVRALNGVLPAAERGVLGVVACTGGFTREARSFAGARGIQLWDEAMLSHLEAEAPD